MLVLAVTVASPLTGQSPQHLHRQARAGRNPKMEDLVQIPTKQVPWFIAGKALRALVHQPER